MKENPLNTLIRNRINYASSNDDAESSSGSEVERYSPQDAQIDGMIKEGESQEVIEETKEYHEWVRDSLGKRE